MRDPTWLIFGSNEIPVVNYEAQDLKMIQVHKRLEVLQQF
jgi:hypothetical protein